MDSRVNPRGDNTNGGSDGIRPNPDRAPKRKVDHTRMILHQLEMRKEKSEGISRDDRVDRQNKHFNQYISVIDHVVGNIKDNIIKEEYKSKIQAISQRYPKMFTVVIEKYPTLFGKEVPQESAGPSQHTGEEQPLLPKTDDKLPELIE